MISKPDVISQVKKSLAAGDVEDAGELLNGPDAAKWVAAAIKVPVKRKSILARSKKIENKVSRYLWGTDRVWKDQEDLRNDELRMVGEVKSVAPGNEWSRGGPYRILVDALDQLYDAVKGTDKESYTHFAVLAPVGKNVKSFLVMVVGDRCCVEEVYDLARFKEMYCK